MNATYTEHFNSLWFYFPGTPAIISQWPSNCEPPREREVAISLSPPLLLLQAEQYSIFQKHIIMLYRDHRALVCFTMLYNIGYLIVPTCSCLLQISGVEI